IPTRRNEAVGGVLADGSERWFYIDGACEIALPAGAPLRIQSAKGPVYRPIDESVTLGAGQMALRFAISKKADSRESGCLAVDTRCHFLSPHDALLEAAAEDLDVVNLLATVQLLPSIDGTAYPTAPNLLAFSGQQPALEAAGRAVIVNTLNIHPVLGKVALLNSHRPVFPLTFGGEETDDWGICDWCDQCHRKGGLVVWVDAFEPAGGLVGGEALVAAILGKVDAIEIAAAPRKVPLLPWLYRLWNAGVLIPLVGASGKDSNRLRLGAMRTHAIPAAGETWIDAVRAGCSTVSSGPLLAITGEKGLCCVSVGNCDVPGTVEMIANGEVIAADSTSTGTAFEKFDGPGWVAGRCSRGAAFAHTPAMAVGATVRVSRAVESLVKLIGHTREWAAAHGRYANPKHREQLLRRCDEAIARLESKP
ncbi:MAG TPA: hypothetical protein VLM40_03285, partial [Gemmata sp.]|nr:hypothetical protein [Gemmata sp.]